MFNQNTWEQSSLILLISVIWILDRKHTPLNATDVFKISQNFNKKFIFSSAMIASNNLRWNLEKFSFAFWQYTFDYIWPNINSTFNDNDTRIIPLPLLSVDLKHFNKHKLKYSFLEVFSVLHTCENDIDMTIHFFLHIHPCCTVRFQVFITAIF